MWKNLNNLWQYRQLIITFVERDIKARYRQTAMGISWAVLQPLLMTVIFTIVFSKFLSVSTDGLPYPVFSFIALAPWTFLSRALTSGSVSLTSNYGLISKVYFPRDVLPFSTVLSLLIDFGLSVIFIGILLLVYAIPLSWHLIFFPIILVVQIVLAVALSLFSSALVILFRDLIYVVPFFVQIGLYASPVVYSVKNLQPFYQPFFYLNPVTGIIEGYRSIFLYHEIPNLYFLMSSIVFAFLLLIVSYWLFKRVERFLADVI